MESTSTLKRQLQEMEDEEYQRQQRRDRQLTTKERYEEAMMILGMELYGGTDFRPGIP